MRGYDGDILMIYKTKLVMRKFNRWLWVGVDLESIETVTPATTLERRPIACGAKAFKRTALSQGRLSGLSRRNQTLARILMIGC